MLIPDIIKEIIASMREDYCFLVNHLAVLLMMLVLIYLDDEKGNKLLKPLMLGLVLLIYPFHAAYMCSSWDSESYRIMLNFLFLPIVAAYTIYCVSERYEGKKRIVAMILGVCLIIACCSFDRWNLAHFRFSERVTSADALSRAYRISFTESVP